MNRARIYCPAPADRDALCTILARCGYTVRQGRERKSGKTSAPWVYFVEFWEGQA